MIENIYFVAPMILLHTFPFAQFFHSPAPPCLLALSAACLQFPADFRSGAVDGALLSAIEKAACLMKGQGKQAQGVAVAVGISATLQLDAWLTAAIGFRYKDRERPAARSTPIAFIAGLVRHR